MRQYKQEKYHIYESNDAILNKTINEGAAFFIECYYQALLRDEKSRTGKVLLSDDLKDYLKEQALQHYLSTNEDFLREVEAIGA